MEFASRGLKTLWSDPRRSVETLDSFARTEEDAGLDLLAAATRVGDPDLRRSLELHAADELKHAELFRTRANEIRASMASTATRPEVLARAYDLARGGAAQDLNDHGFFRPGLWDDRGPVAYVAMLYVAEQRAETLFRRHKRALAGNERMLTILDEILRDEKFHVAYTANLLKHWRREGRQKEVRAALRQARGSRILGAWKRLGARSAAGLARGSLFVLYWTLLVPFALQSKRRRPDVGVRDRTRPPSKLASQYE